MEETPNPTRKKAIKTLAKKDHISEQKAKQKQAIAIAYSKASKENKK